MGIKVNFQVQRLDETQPGDLVRLRGTKNSVLAFAAGKQSLNRFGVITLQPAGEHFSAPTLLYPNIENVVNYGPDWILETIDTDDLVTGNHSYRETCGVVFVGAKGNTILARNPDQFGDGWHFDMSTWTGSVNGDQGSAPVPYWRLWANQSDMDHVRGKPLMTFDAREKETAR